MPGNEKTTVTYAKAIIFASRTLAGFWRDPRKLQTNVKLQVQEREMWVGKGSGLVTRQEV